MFPRIAQPVAATLVGLTSLPLARRPQSEDIDSWLRRRVSCEQACERYVDAKFHGMHKRSLVNVGEWHPVTLCPPLSASNAFKTLRYMFNVRGSPVDVKVRDAREKEAMEGLSKPEFFKRYGFVLQQKKSLMTADDWNTSATKPLGVAHLTGKGMPREETPLSRIYYKEIREIVQDLFPEAKSIELDPLVGRRGPGTNMPDYNFAPHQDYGFSVEDWPLNGNEFEAFQERFSRPDVKGLVVLNFWRPVLPMKGPVQKTPLAVCNPATVKLDDVIPINVKRDDSGYSKMLDLSHNPEQEWYYYPDMTVDEVLVFKTFQHIKGQDQSVVHTCFHTAFENPQAPPRAEIRHSCEYRVRIWF